MPTLDMLQKLNELMHVEHSACCLPPTKCCVSVFYDFPTLVKYLLLVEIPSGVSNLMASPQSRIR